MGAYISFHNVNAVLSESYTSSPCATLGFATENGEATIFFPLAYADTLTRVAAMLTARIDADTLTEADGDLIRGVGDYNPPGMEDGFDGED